MSNRIQELENRLVNFDPLREGSINEFKDIVDHMTENDKKALGQKYQIWKLGCLYHFMTCPEYKTNVGHCAPAIIQKFQETEANILKNATLKKKEYQDLLKILWCSTRSSDYLDVLDGKQLKGVVIQT